MNEDREKNVPRIVVTTDDDGVPGARLYLEVGQDRNVFCYEFLRSKESVIMKVLEHWRMGDLDQKQSEDLIRSLQGLSTLPAYEAEAMDNELAEMQEGFAEEQINALGELIEGALAVQVNMDPDLLPAALEAQKRGETVIMENGSAYLH